MVEIEQQVRVFERAAKKGEERPSLNEMVGAVLDARRSDDLVPLKVTADLYIEADDGRRFYFEIKSPMPNKGQCLEVTQRLLRFHLIAGGKNSPMNPGGEIAHRP